MCTFWTSQLPKTLGKWSTFDILASKGASRHSSSVQFYLSPPTRWLRTHRFTEATFLPRATKDIEKTLFRDLSTLSRTLTFFLLTLSSLTLSLLWSSFCWLSLLWHLLFSDRSHNCCCISPYVGNLASKLPSTNISNTIILTNPYHAIHNAPFDRCLPSIVQRCSKYQLDIHRTRMKASYGFGVGLMHDDSYHQVFVRSGRQVACTVKQFLKT